MLARHAARRVLAIPRRGFAGTSIPQGVPGASTRYVEDQIPIIQTQILPRVASDGGALGPTNQVSSTAPIATLGSAADGVHAAEHHHHEVELWKKITGVGSVFVAAVFLNWMASEHHHMHTPPPYGYLRVRTKPFPWGDKDLLDVRDTYVDDDDHH